MTSSNPPDCWQKGKGPETGPTSTGSSYWTSDGFANDGSSGSARINLYTTNREDWLISPLFDLSADSYQLEFDVAITAYSSTDPSNMGSDDQVKLFITTDGGVTWTTLETWDVNNTPSNTGNHKIYDLSSYNLSDVQFAFWATDGSTNDTEDYNFYVDNFQIRILVPCQAPTDLSVSNITDTSAKLNWTDNYNTNSTYIVEWRETGTSTWNSATAPIMFMI